MSTDSKHRQQLRELLGQLDSLSEEEQARFLEVLGSTDPGLRDEVQSTRQLQTGAPPAMSAWALPPADFVGRSVGKIKVLEVLGEGGMGKVYVGYDEKLKRKVALKSIRRRHAVSEDIKARFLQEAQILSRLEHPNICQIYDYIEDAESDFLVLELIDGQDLQRWLEGPTSRAEKMQAALQIADVLVAAHAAGIVHRDLKPANVMVTRAGQVKVLDFGIARSISDGGDSSSGRLAKPSIDDGEATIPIHTRTGSLYGTPLYMSPEQANGDPVNAASDVFAFGLLLQEIFTGQAAYDRSRPNAELIGAVARGETRPLSGVDADLTALIRRLLVVAAELRPTALDTAERLRWIRDAPLRRRRAQWRATAMIGLALIAAAMSFLAYRIRQEAARARLEATTSERVVGLLVSLFEASDPFEEASGVWRERAGELTVRQVLERGAEKIGRDLGDQPVVRARLQDDIGEIYHHLGFFGEAGVLLEEGLAVRIADLGEDHPEVAASLQHLATLRQDTGRFDEAAEALSKALAIRERHAETDPLGLAEALAVQADLESQQGQLSEAETLLRRALALREADPGARESLIAQSVAQLGIVLEQQGRLAEAAELAQRALEIRERTLGPDHPMVAWSLNSLGIILDQQGDYDAARERFSQALEINERQLGAAHPGAAMVLMNLAILHNRQGRYDEAEEAYQQARQRFESVLGSDHPRVGEVLGNLGTFYLQQGRYQLAEPAFQRAREIFEGAFGVSHPYVGMCVGSLGTLAAERRRYEEAEPLFRQAIEIFSGALGPQHSEVARTQSHLASVLEKEGRLDESIELASAAVSMAEQAVGPEHPDVAAYLAGLAEAEIAAGRLDEGENHLHRAADIQQAALGLEDPGYVRILKVQGELATARGDAAAVIGHYRAAISLVEHRFGLEHPALAQLLRQLADALRNRGERVEAEAIDDRAARLEEAAGIRRRS